MDVAVSGPGATIALALQFIRTNDAAVAAAFELPHNAHTLDLVNHASKLLDVTFYMHRSQTPVVQPRPHTVATLESCRNLQQLACTVKQGRRISTHHVFPVHLQSAEMYERANFCNAESAGPCAAAGGSPRSRNVGRRATHPGVAARSAATTCAGALPARCIQTARRQMLCTAAICIACAMMTRSGLAWQMQLPRWLEVNCYSICVTGAPGRSAERTGPKTRGCRVGRAGRFPSS